MNRPLFAPLLPLLITACASVSPSLSTNLPETARTTPAFVVAANPLAAEAGMAVLRRGGSAVDAAVAVQAMLSLVEPQSSGVGGGAFLHYFDGRNGTTSIYDGREVAPGGAGPKMFLGPEGKPLPFDQAVVSGRATGVPGAVRMLEVAQAEHGALSWSSLFGDAERTAQDGFIVSPRLARLVAGNFPQTRATDALAYFDRGDGSRVRAGDRLRNPAYAAFLRRLAIKGSKALLEGETAERIVARTRAGPLGGSMTIADLAAYRPIKRASLCRPYRVLTVCAPPPPSSGVALLQLIGIAERTDLGARGPGDPQAWYLFAEATRLMFADRDRFVADPKFAEVPVAGLLAPDYLGARARLIAPTAGPAPSAGNPAGAPVTARDRTLEPTGTSHFIVGDANGNVVSMTTTVESVFGSGRMVDGFFLNNQLTDFSFAPVDEAGRPAANAVAPGKRPRSSMIPLILIDRQGRFAGALGSAGGSAILPYVAKALIGAVDWGLPMQQAIALPNLVARGSSFQGEIGKFSPTILAGLAARGVVLKPGQGEDSGLHGVIIREGRIDGGFDPRREGVVRIDTSGARPRRRR